MFYYLSLPKIVALQIETAKVKKNRKIRNCRKETGNNCCTAARQGPAILLHGCKTDFPILLQFLTKMSQDPTILLHGC